MIESSTNIFVKLFSLNKNLRCNPICYCRGKPIEMIDPKLKKITANPIPKPRLRIRQTNPLSKQRGYLLIVAVIFILIMSFLSLATGAMVSGSASANLLTEQSNQAFYLSESGIEYAKHQLNMNGVACANINYSNITFPGSVGAFSVTATGGTINTTLSSAINNSVTTIPITSATGLASSGSVLVDGDEVIAYTGISGNTLTGATRGGGAAPLAHNIASTVTQTLCSFTSTGGVPNVTAATAQSQVSNDVIVLSALVGSIGSSSATILGSVNLSGGATVTNVHASSSTENFPGSTFNLGGTINISNGSTTSVSNSSGTGTSTASQQGSVNADVTQNNSSLSSGGTSGLFNLYFGQSEATVQSNANKVYTTASNNTDYSSVLAGSGYNVVWINQKNGAGTATISAGGTVVGSQANPMLLIVNGNFSISNGTSFYGFIFATGNITQSAASIYGGVGAGGNYTSSNGSALAFNSGELNQITQYSNSGFKTTTVNGTWKQVLW
jgi:Tfp pilus assembly protein PilX